MITYTENLTDAVDPSGESMGPNQAAWCWGIQHWDTCKAGLRTRDIALKKRKKHYNRLRARGYSPSAAEAHANALQHVMWMALTTLRTGDGDEARELGIAHEMDTTKPGQEFGSPDSKKDLLNNDVGIRWGSTAREQGWTQRQLVHRLIKLAKTCPSQCFHLY